LTTRGILRDMEDELLSTREVAKRLKLCRVTVQRLMRRGEIPAVKVGRSWRVRRSALEDRLRDAR
jgi:excisionase family DNA binding protein